MIILFALIDVVVKNSQKIICNQLFSDRPNGEATIPIALATDPGARIEEENMTVVATVGRRGPIVAVAANIVEIETAAIGIGTGRGEEYCTALPSRNLSTLYAIQRCPFICAVVHKFLHLVFCRHSPGCTPVSCCCIIFGTSNVITNICTFVRICCTRIPPFERFRLAPTIIVATLLWCTRP